MRNISGLSLGDFFLGGCFNCNFNSLFVVRKNGLTTMHEKTEQYQEVKMQQTWKVKSKVVPAIIGALGDISSIM